MVKSKYLSLVQSRHLCSMYVMSYIAKCTRNIDGECTKTTRSNIVFLLKNHKHLLIHAKLGIRIQIEKHPDIDSTFFSTLLLLSNDRCIKSDSF